MRKPARLLVVGFLAAGLAALFQPSSRAQPIPTRALDQTFLCATRMTGGSHEIEARAHAGVREGSRWRKLAFAGVVTPTLGGNTTALDPSALVWITAARPRATTTIGHEGWTTPVLAHGTLAVSQKLCKTVKGRAPLSSGGLQGSAASQLGEALDCASPRRVLVRVRAVFESATRLRPRSGYLRTTAHVDEAAFVVRSQSGKPMVFASVAASGRASLFTAPNCVPDG